jgi:hypothetical protein
MRILLVDASFHREKRRAAGAWVLVEAAGLAPTALASAVPIEVSSFLIDVVRFPASATCEAYAILVALQEAPRAEFVLTDCRAVVDRLVELDGPVVRLDPDPVVSKLVREIRSTLAVLGTKLLAVPREVTAPADALARKAVAAAREVG